jgi:hypothetical protein
MFPTTHDPTSPFHILAPTYNPLIEQYACGAGGPELRALLGLSERGMPEGRGASSMKPWGRTMKGPARVTPTPSRDAATQVPCLRGELL